MQLDTGQWAVLILAGILILGFILGYYTNRQRAEMIFAWLKRGLGTMGTVSLGEKLPGMSTGGRLEVNQASAPLKRVEAVYLLAPRENILFWVFHLIRGRGDELVVWMTYQSKPEQTVELARKGDKQFAKRLEATDKPQLAMIEAPGKLQAAAEGGFGSQKPSRVMEFAQRYQSNIIRLALRPEKPHLFLRINLRVMSRLSSEQFFSELKQLGGE